MNALREPFAEEARLQELERLKEEVRREARREFHSGLHVERTLLELAGHVSRPFKWTYFPLWPLPSPTLSTSRPARSFN